MQQLEEWPIDRLIDYARNPRKNDHAVDAVAGAIREFGFKVPIVARSDGTVVDGHLRLKAAKKLKLATVPVLLADDLTDAQVRAFRLSVNKLAELAEWDEELLANELSDLHADEFDMALLGFDVDELGELLGIQGEQNTENDIKAAVTQSLQVIPGKEYCLILCDSETEWSQLRDLLCLGLVSRGGYKEGSAFNSVGAERVITMGRFMERLNNADSDTV